MYRPDLTAPPWLALAQTIRARAQLVTPYRLGLEAGRAGQYLENPYRLPRSRDAFAEGVKRGRTTPSLNSQKGTP